MRPAGLRGLPGAMWLLGLVLVLPACGGGTDEWPAPPAGAPTATPSANAPAAGEARPPVGDASGRSRRPAPVPGPSYRAWWKPTAATTWQWQLLGPLNTGYDVAVYDIDLFDTPADTIAALKAAGRRVVCYFSAGSSEDWRPDFHRFHAADLGQPLDGWDGERWLDIRSARVRALMAERLDLAAAKGCDGVEPDNVDGHANDSGFALTPQDQLDFNRYLADQAHARRLAIGLKNDVGQLAALQPWFDFAVNEQCAQYDECGGYSVFTASDKPVFHVEYAGRYRDNSGGARDALCAASRAAGLRTLVLPLDLDDAFRFSCD